ncbi:MAG TPA: hypothetical protein VFA37_09865 [Gaiellaceae bacterium]|nr:hypothetical protein [Gaiellaceae bacterium]
MDIALQKLEEAERLIGAGKVRQGLAELDIAVYNLRPTTADYQAVARRIRAAAETAARSDNPRLVRKAQEIARQASGRETQIRDARSQDPSLAVQARGLAVAKDVTPLSLGLSLLGAIVMFVAVFLPRADSTTFARIADNTMIQNGDGWVFVGLAAAVGVASWYAYQRRAGGAGVLILGAIAVAFAVFWGTNRSSLTLCPVGPVAAYVHLGCQKASPGVGIYAAGVGGLLAFAGGWGIWRAMPFEEIDESEEDDDEQEVPDSQRAPSSTNLAEQLARVTALYEAGSLSDEEFAAAKARLLAAVPDEQT